ncbi:RsmD family RNA methyltransferase [Leptospira ilyithenensis]|uniref:DNA methyltransferase n=1 Tax=Leptospira ilyithenensis TaxID=2484901 RepID=A0A4R9LL22_9LEPT|nr:RsmD family RNA methyltransferase [Leptospira ilyithenensis]TGN06844.1 DNA methyltransferase [Leptospira ilyithenensis]
MKSLRVGSGKWRGKEISAPDEISGHQNFTNSLIKKAIFSLIDSRLSGWDIRAEDCLFCDYFSGSGQIAAEAYSLDFARILVYELDQDRFGKLLKLFKGLANVKLFRKDATKHALKWEQETEKAYIFYLDPPYTYWSETPDRMKLMIENLYAHCSTLSRPSIILCQIPEHQKSDKIWVGVPFKEREYGSHSLIETIFEM